MRDSGMCVLNYPREAASTVEREWNVMREETRNEYVTIS